MHGSALAHLEPMDVEHEYRSDFRRRQDYARAIRFVVVNNRVPCADQHCAVCGGPIEKGYVSNSQTRLIYCDTQCLAGWAHGAVSNIKNYGRKAS